MRILGEIKHPTLKITVLSMNNRLAIKFENGSYEQTYKLREDERFSNLSHIEKLIDSEFIDSVQSIFKKMHSTQTRAVSKMIEPEGDDLPVII